MRNTRYFQWLTSLIRDRDYSDYTKLLRLLFEEEFRWDYAIPTDSARADDGIDLRLLYFSDRYDPNVDADEPCNVLEMLVALALRIERDITGEPGFDHPEIWFWQFISNLDLLSETDDDFDENYVINTLGNWMARKFRPDGYGGIFPLKHPPTDQRHAAIWDQMSAYINEVEDL